MAQPLWMQGTPVDQTAAPSAAPSTTAAATPSAAPDWTQGQPVDQPVMPPVKDIGVQTGPSSAPQMQGGFRLPAMFGSATVKSVMDALGLPGDAEAAIHRGLAWVTGQMGLPPPPSWTTTNILPTSSAMESLLPSGTINRPDLQPQNETEQLTQAAGQGTGAAIPFLAGGPIASLVKTGEATLPSILSAGRALLSGVGGGVGGYEGSKAGPSGSLASTAGQLAGGLLGGTAADVAAGGLGKVAATAMGAPSPALDAYDRLGITPRMVGDVTQEPSLQMLQKFGAKMPGGMGPTEQAAEETLGEFNNAVQRTADNFGPQQTPQQAGQVLQGQVRSWVNNMLPAIRSIVWLPVNKAIPSDTPMPLTNYRTTLESLTNPTPGMAATGAALTPKTASNLLDALNKDVPAGGTASWKTAQTVLHNLGDTMGTPSFVQDIGQQRLNALYAALHQDMATTADRFGVGPQFNYANDASTKLYQTRDQLSAYANAKNPSLETVDPDRAANSALANNSDLQTIRAVIPDAADALAAYQLRQLGMRGGTGGAEGQTVSPGSFLTALNNMRMRRPEGTDALFGGSQGVSDLSQVAQNMKSTERFANPSGTAGHEAWGEAIRNAVAATGGALAGRLSTGEMLPAIGAAVGAPLAGYGIARAVTSPTVARFIGTPSLAPRVLPRSVVPAAILGR